MKIIVKVFEFLIIFFSGIIFYNFIAWLSRRISGNAIFYCLLFVMFVPVYYFSFHPQSAHIPSKDHLMFLAFFFISMLSPILVPEIKQSFKENNGKRLEIILAVMTILTIPLGLDLLRNAITSNNAQLNSNTNVRKHFDISITFSNAQWTQNGGDKTSYYKLISWMKNPNDENDKSILINYLSQIKLSYISTDSVVRNVPLCKAQLKVECSELESEESEYLDNIFDQFINAPLWISKAKAAYLLRITDNNKIKKTIDDKRYKISWDSIIQALVNAMISPKSPLLVSKTALDTFRILVPGFKTISPVPTIDNPDTVFAFEDANNYWKSKRPEILALKEKGN